MKKLALKLDDLAVESFETVTADETRGTVLGNADTASCPGYSCAVTCGVAISPGSAALLQTGNCGNTFNFCCV